MGKFMAALLLVFVIELSMFLFVAADSQDTPTALFTWLKDPSSSANPFYGNILSQVMKIAAATAVIIGLFFIIRVEVAYAGITVVALGFFMSIVRFWNFIASQGAWQGNGWLPATILCAPLIIFYTIATFDFMRAPG